MLARVSGVFKKTNRNMQLPLGRWGTIKNESDNDKNIQERIEKNATSGNHDHCGSELCKTPTESKKNNENLKKIIEDPYLFYIM